MVEELTLFAAAVWVVNPEPGTVAPSRWAGWHVSGNLEIGEPVPNAGLVHAENYKVFGLDVRDIRFVSDGKSTSSQIIKAL